MSHKTDKTAPLSSPLKMAATWTEVAEINQTLVELWSTKVNHTLLPRGKN